MWYKSLAILRRIAPHRLESRPLNERNVILIQFWTGKKLVEGCGSTSIWTLFMAQVLFIIVSKNNVLEMKHTWLKKSSNGCVLWDTRKVWRSSALQNHLEMKALLVEHNFLSAETNLPNTASNGNRRGCSQICQNSTFMASTKYFTLESKNQAHYSTIQ